MRVKLTYVPPVSPCHGCRAAVVPGAVTCSRCHTNLPGSVLPDGVMTAGYYDVRGTGGWADYANPGEQFICDSCMWADPRYIAVHGLHLATGGPVEAQTYLVGSHQSDAAECIPVAVRKGLSERHQAKQVGFVSVCDLVSPTVRLK